MHLYSLSASMTCGPREGLTARYVLVWNTGEERDMAAKSELRQFGRLGVLAAAIALVATSGCSPTTAPTEDKPEYVAPAVHDFHFNSLMSMAATADIVIIGTVESITRGRARYVCDDPSGVCEPSDSNYSGQLREVSISIEMLAGGESVDGAIILEEWGYDRKGNPFEIEEAPWSRIGDRGAFFLRQWPSQPDGHFYLVHPVGRILTHRGAANESEGPTAYPHTVSFADGELADYIRGIPVTDLPEIITEAVRAAEAGDIPPQEPLEWLRN